MRLLKKQYNRQYKKGWYFIYTRRTWLGLFKEKWEFFGACRPSQAAGTEHALETRGFVYANNDWR